MIYGLSYRVYLGTHFEKRVCLNNRYENAVKNLPSETLGGDAALLPTDFGCDGLSIGDPLLTCCEEGPRST